MPEAMPGVTPSYRVKIKHRCNHEEIHGFAVAIKGTDEEKTAKASLRGRFCSKCTTTREQKERIAVAKKEYEEGGEEESG